MSAFRYMLFFYAAMVGVPVLLWLIAVLSPVSGTALLRLVLSLLAGIGSIIFGIVGFREVFVHGR